MIGNKKMRNAAQYENPISVVNRWIDQCRTIHLTDEHMCLVANHEQHQAEYVKHKPECSSLFMAEVETLVHSSNKVSVLVKRIFPSG